MNNALDPSEERFFEQGEVASPELSEELPPSPEASVGIGADESARRARLRRVVASALLGSVALFGVGLVRQFGAPQLPPEARKPERRATLWALQPAAPNTQQPSAAAAPASLSSQPLPAVNRPPSVDASALIRSARTLLEAGHTRDGVAVARSAVSANPQNAEPYILLAAGLQDLGKWAEAQTVFATCKQATSSGPNATCRYFAGAR